MDTQRAVIVVHVRPSYLAYWFHRLFTRPVVEVDGQERTGPWGVLEVPVSEGEHRLGVYFRYRGQSRARLGESSRDITVRASDRRLAVKATLGPLNGSSFRISEPEAS